MSVLPPQHAAYGQYSQQPRQYYCGDGYEYEEERLSWPPVMLGSGYFGPTSTLPPFMMPPYGSNAAPPHATGCFYANPTAMNTMVPAGAQPFMVPSQPPMWNFHHSQPEVQPSRQSAYGGRIQGRDEEDVDNGVKNNELKRKHSESSSGSSDESSDEE